MRPATGHAPRIVVTLMVAADQPEPDIAARKNALYVDAVVRHGAAAVPLDATSSAATRGAAFATMDGLLLTGGADLDPGRYGEPNNGSQSIEQDRDELEAAAWAAAESRGVPVLGICRGFQAMNAFAGGKLVQHVDGHAGAGWGHGPALTHPLRLVPGTRLTRILSPTNVGGGVLAVNSYHHQAVRPVDLAPRYAPAALSPSPAGDLVEAFEATSGPFRMAVQCHPERTESTPKAFERLFAFFVDSCRGPAATRCRGPARRRAAGRWLEAPRLDGPVEELARPGFAGLREDLLRQPLLEDAAAVEEAHAVRDVAREPHLVGGDQHRHATGGQLPDHVEHLRHQLRVQGGRHLVEQEEVRVHGQRPDDRHPLLLTPDSRSG
jgi:putative glutamine amidotransferase